MAVALVTELRVAIQNEEANRAIAARVRSDVPTIKGDTMNPGDLIAILFAIVLIGFAISLYRGALRR